MAVDPSGADRNLLYGILAMRTGFLSREALIAGIEAWLPDRGRPLSDVLIARGDLNPAVHPLIEQVVARHLDRILQPGGDTADFALVDPLPEILRTVVDPDLQASIARVRVVETEADPHGPRTSDATTAWGPTPVANTLIAHHHHQGNGQASADAHASPHGEPPPLPHFDRFRVLRPHAEGGLGEVHVAWDEELGREVALKEIRPKFADDPRARSRFVREAEVTGNLDHPGVVPVYSLGTRPDGRPYYAMRFVHGETLQQILERDHREAKSLSPLERLGRLRRLLRRFIDICDTIEYAHGRGVLHRDLKPANILIGSHGEAVIIDWGLAKVLGAPDDDDSPQENVGPTSVSEVGHGSINEPVVLHSSLGSSIPTDIGETLGSPPYMSPEQARGLNNELDRLTDVYSLGATLYTVLVGKPPVRGSKTPEVLARVISGEIVPPLGANPDAPAPLAEICLTAMRLDPSRRYPTARALADDVQRWLDDQPVSVYPDGIGTRALRWARQHRPLVTASLALTLITVVGLVVTTALINAQKDEAIAAKRETEKTLTRALAAEETTRDIAYNFLEVVSLADRQIFTQMRPANREKFLAAGVRFAGVYRDVAGNDPIPKLRAAEVAMRLATLYRVTGRFEEASGLYADGVAILEGLAGAPGASSTQIDRLAEALMEQGDAWQTLGKVQDASTSFQRAADLARANLNANGRPEFRRTLGRALSRLSSASLELGKAEAPELAGRAIEALLPTAIASTPETERGHILSAADQLELAQAQANQAEGLVRAGQADEALALFREAFARADRLAKQFRGPKWPDLDFNQAWFAIRLARALTDRGSGPELDEALNRLNDAVNRLQKIQGGDAPILAYRTALADALIARARVRLARSESDDARTDAQTAGFDLQPLRATYPGVVELPTLHAEAMEAMARADLARNPRSTEAKSLATKAVQLQTLVRDANPANPVAGRRLEEYQAVLDRTNKTP